MDFTLGVEFDSKTCVGDLFDCLKAPVVGTVTKANNCINLNTLRGVYMPRWSDKKDDTIFICHESVDTELLRNDLYKSDFGYTFSEIDQRTWTSVDGEHWLASWTVCSDRSFVNTPDTTTEGLIRSFCTSLGSRERLSRSILIIPDEKLARLRSGNYGRVILKKIQRTHGKTIYTLVDKSNDSKDIGFLIICSNAERKKPPALHVVRDIDSRIFCILIGDNAKNRFLRYNKESVYNLFTHHEGKIYKANYEK